MSTTNGKVIKLEKASRKQIHFDVPKHFRGLHEPNRGPSFTMFWNVFHFLAKNIQTQKTQLIVLNDFFHYYYFQFSIHSEGLVAIVTRLRPCVQCGTNSATLAMYRIWYK